MTKESQKISKEESFYQIPDIEITKNDIALFNYHKGFLAGALKLYELQEKYDNLLKEYVETKQKLEWLKEYSE